MRRREHGDSREAPQQPDGALQELSQHMGSGKAAWPQITDAIISHMRKVRNQAFPSLAINRFISPKTLQMGQVSICRGAINKQILDSGCRILVEDPVFSGDKQG